MSIATEEPQQSLTVKQTVGRRLRPLNLAVFLQSLVIWFAAEKLFLSEIGFTPAAIGLMAAVYAGVVPLVEFPSGILADRWSRRGVFAVACVSMAGCSLLGGLSDGVGLYLVSAAFLGITLATQSGTVDSMVYDLLVEETGDGTDFTRRIGRVRLLEGLGLTAGALLGGVVAELSAPRAHLLRHDPAGADGDRGGAEVQRAAAAPHRGAGLPARTAVGHPAHHRRPGRGDPRAAAGRGGRRRAAAGLRVRTALAGGAGGAGRRCSDRTGRR